jgi:GR25 family glycosyltransferase involved in LPS biosynthesis
MHFKHLVVVILLQLACPTAPVIALPPHSPSSAAVGGAVGPSHTWPAWVITLARTPGRLQRFRRSSHAYEEFPRLKEFAATDGRTLNVLTDKRISVRSRVRSRDALDRRSHSDLQSLGMSGLYISHVEVWREFLASGEAVGLVLEDDAVVERGVGAAIDAALANPGMPSPEAWDVWLVGALAIRASRPAPVAFGQGWLEATDWWGTQAYVLTRRGAAALLAHAYPADAQIDAYMAQMAMLGEILALSKEGLDIPQFAWYTLGGTTVQMYQIYCDACDLAHGFTMQAENTFLRCAGLLAGALAALLWQPYLSLRKKCQAAGICVHCPPCCCCCWRRKEGERKR